ncbi:MAG TPA: pitrilysin family protein [bacterium]|nr:pitrilysin family protein [bacterium]
MKFSRFRTKGLFLCALCVLCGSDALWGRPPQLPEAPPLDIQVPAFSSVTLGCGMKVVFLPDPSLPLVSGQLLIPGGKVADPVGKEGLGEWLCGGLRDAGAGDLSPEAFDAALENKAASMGASAEMEDYTASFKCLSKDLTEVLGLFTDMLRKPRFDEKRMATERDQDMDGLDRLEDTPDALSRVVFYKALYPGSPYGRWASPKTVGAFTRGDAVRQYEDHFGPQGSVLVLAGNFDQAQVTADLEKAFAGWARKAPKVMAPEEKPQGPVIYFYPKDVTQVFVRWGVQGLPRHDAMDVPLQVANYILGGSGFTSHLMREIRSNRGLAYFVDSVAQPFDGRGLFEVIGGTRPDSVKEFLEQMFGILEDFDKNGPTEGEVAEAQRSMIEEFAYNFESVFSLAGYKGSLDFHGYPDDYLAGYRDRIRAVTRDQAAAAAKRILDQKQWVLVICGPQDLQKDLEGFGKVIPVTSIFDPLPKP